MEPNVKIINMIICNYKEKNFIPDVSLAFTNFEEFFTEREKLLVNRLKKELM